MTTLGYLQCSCNQLLMRTDGLDEDQLLTIHFQQD